MPKQLWQELSCNTVMKTLGLILLSHQCDFSASSRVAPNFPWPQDHRQAASRAGLILSMQVPSEPHRRQSGS